MSGPNIVTTSIRVCARGRASGVVTGRRCTTCGWSVVDPVIEDQADDGTLFGAEDLRSEHTAEQCAARRAGR